MNMIGKTLRSPLIPRALSYQLWRAAGKGHGGERFFFRTSLFGKRLTYGGVRGFSDHALFLDLERYESETAPVIAQILAGEPEPVVFDIGANNGQFLAIVKSLCSQARMHCFEPFPALADFLIELVRRNSFTDVCINNLLASESDGAVELFFQEGATDTASSVRGFQQSFNSSLTTQRCSLDSYFESRQLDKLTLIKIDVEGGELEVLRGARRLIRETQPIIILELLYTSKSEHLIRQEETIAILKEMNYKFFPIRGNGRWEEQISVRPDPTYKFPNYLVCKNDPC